MGTSNVLSVNKIWKGFSAKLIETRDNRKDPTNFYELLRRMWVHPLEILFQMATEKLSNNLIYAFVGDNVAHIPYISRSPSSSSPEPQNTISWLVGTSFVQLLPSEILFRWVGNPAETFQKLQFVSRMSDKSHFSAWLELLEVVIRFQTLHGNVLRGKNAKFVFNGAKILGKPEENLKAMEKNERNFSISLGESESWTKCNGILRKIRGLFGKKWYSFPRAETSVKRSSLNWKREESIRGGFPEYETRVAKLYQSRWRSGNQTKSKIPPMHSCCSCGGESPVWWPS